MSLINKLWIKLFYTKVGEDQFGNIYYTSEQKNYLGVNKRYVCYNGLDESSKVPPMWHAWLHYLSNEIPFKIKSYNWQQNYQPNLTGTKNSYHPQIANSGLKTYSAWVPNANNNKESEL
ncbi:MAG: hypothetical protein H6909_02125 [Rickettsiaceae bacterium]|nr:hypothetical protein [Rickettsiaceae bacterium]